jgi:hypothetical protein
MIDLGYPRLTAEQVAVLEELFPARCYQPGIETLEDHLKYSGKVELIAALKANSIDGTVPGAELSPEEAEALIDDEVARIAANQQML